MKKLISLLTLGAILLPCASEARELSESEALNRAGAFLDSNKAGMKGLPGGKPSLNLAYSSAKSFYVFERGSADGFVIVSADDRLPEVLGYSDRGSFDYTALPPNLKWWLGEYEKEIQSFLSSDNSLLSAASYSNAADDRAEIDALVTTKWNQSTPFNNDCPVDAGGRSVTGCAATALAQIVNYHKWPQGPGNGSYSYQWQGQTLGFDYGNTTFAWNAMLDEYNSSSPADACAAVANLMYACGVGINMAYSSRESGAVDFGIPRVLVENLDYSGGVSIRSRDSYSAEQWEDLIYTELAASRPVFYTGQASTGGHAFVCDGYAGNRYFHINWGWGGASDGNFLLSALNPSDQGIGSYEGGYNSSQSAIIGIRPQDGVKYNANLVSKGTFESVGGNLFTLTSVYSYSFTEQKVTFGISAVNDATGEHTDFWGGGTSTFPAADPATGKYSGLGFTTRITPNGLPAGVYKLYPIYKNDSGAEAERLMMPYGAQQYVLLTVGEDGSLTYSNPGSEVATNLEVLGFGAAGKVYRNTTTQFNISIKNHADAAYNNTIKFEVQKDGQSVGADVSVRLSIGAGATFSGSFSHAYDLAPGVYEVFIYDADDNRLNETAFPLTIEEGDAPVLSDGLNVTSFSPSGFYRGYTTTVQVGFMNKSSVDITTSVAFVVYQPDGEAPVSRLTMGSSTFSANARVTYNISGFGFTLPFGNYELAITDGDGEELSPRIPISQYDEFDGLWYGLSSDNTAAVVCAPVSETVDGGIIDVPMIATFNATDYEVTGISDNAFSKYSGLKSLFMRRPVCMVANAQALAGVSSVDVYVPAAVYNDYAAVLVSRSNNLYSIIDRISHRHISGEPESLLLNNDYEFAVDFEPSENINHAIEVSDGGNGIMTFEVNDFMSGTRHVKARAVSVGQGAVTVTSAQPGVEAIAIPVSVSELSSVDNVAALRIDIKAAGGRIYVSGLASGDSVEVYDAAGIMVANRVADNSSLVIDGLGRGFYIVKGGSEVAKISL